MQQEVIFYPVLVLVGHTFIIWCWMYATRLNAILKGKVSIGSYKDRKTTANTSGSFSTPSDNFQNLLETPVLFYVAAVLLFVTASVSEFYIVLA